MASTRAEIRPGVCPGTAWECLGFGVAQVLHGVEDETEDLARPLTRCAFIADVHGIGWQDKEAEVYSRGLEVSGLSWI